MKLVTYEEFGQRKVGIAAGELVLDADLLLKCNDVWDTAFVSDMLSLLESAEEGLSKLNAAMKAAKAKGDLASLKAPCGQPVAVPLSEVKLLPPVPNPRKIFALAGNYMEHIREGRQMDVEIPKQVTPRIFMKPPSNTLVGHGSPIIVSKTSTFVDWEAELGVVIGRRGKYIPKERALEYVAGYTCFNDVSERQLSIRQRPQTQEWDRFFDWLNGKWCDSFAPCGPWIVTSDEIPDPQNLTISLKVNGEEHQHANTADMIFPIADIINYLSHFLTIEPGDIIATGTPSGVGSAKGIKLKPGDVVTIEIEKIGVLENPVAAEG